MKNNCTIDVKTIQYEDENYRICECDNVDEVSLDCLIEPENLLFLMNHSRYNLYTSKELEPYKTIKDFIELRKEIEKSYPDALTRPLYMYDHSAVSIKTSSFNDKWDSGLLGIVVIREPFIKIHDNNHEKIRNSIDAILEEYTDYLNGFNSNVCVYKLTRCEHCENVIEEEFVDGVVTSDVKEIVNEFISSYVKKKES